jgi:thiol-disulfide isomerase/thioredoxin
MPLARPVRAVALLLLLSPIAVPSVPAQPASAPPAPAPATSATATASPVSGIRNKISAADLLSAESMLEVHRAKNGEDGPWLVGYAWLSRGALLLGDEDKARRYSAAVYAECAKRVAAGADLAKDSELAYALGAVIEVEAQQLQARKGRRKAAEYVRSELAKWTAPVSFRSRLNKRIDLLTMEGTPAPEFAIEDFVGEPPPSLASLRGKPVVLYVWDKGCGDCRAQAPALVKTKERFAKSDVEFVALTRYYDNGDERLTEKARADSSWQASHKEMGPVPIVVSDASMERYGGSSTPTFVFIDRKGVVRRYSPTRLTEGELERSVQALLD